MSSAQGSERLAIVGATLIDGSGGRPIAASTVFVEGGHVVHAGPSTSAPPTTGATIVDARGQFLIPGLTDMHVHVYTRDKWHPELYLAAGVTSVMDLGGQLDDVTAHRAMVDAGHRAGPRTFFTGPMLEEGDVFAGFASFSRHVEAASIETEVDALARAGVDGVKLYVSVRPETARRACARAHTHGLPVFMHQHATWGAQAAEVGVDSVEHLNVFGALAPRALWPPDPGRMTPFEYGGWLWSWLGDLDPHADHVRRLYDALIAAGTVLDPTLVLSASRPGALGDDVGDTSMDDPERTPLLPLLPSPVADELVSRWTERRTAAAAASARARSGRGARGTPSSPSWEGFTARAGACSRGRTAPTWPSCPATRCTASWSSSCARGSRRWMRCSRPRAIRPSAWAGAIVSGPSRPAARPTCCCSAPTRSSTSGTRDGSSA
jgi:hypothetical protein